MDIPLYFRQNLSEEKRHSLSQELLDLVKGKAKEVNPGMAYRFTDISVKPIYRHFFKYRLSVSVKVRTDKMATDRCPDCSRYAT